MTPPQFLLTFKHLIKKKKNYSSSINVCISVSLLIFIKDLHDVLV